MSKVGYKDSAATHLKIGFVANLCCLLVDEMICTWLIHWGRDKMAAISRMTLSNIFSWIKMLEFQLKFHWSLFIRIQLTIFQHWFRWRLGADQVISHYLNQWWLDCRSIYASLVLNKYDPLFYEFRNLIFVPYMISVFKCYDFCIMAELKEWMHWTILKTR